MSLSPAAESHDIALFERDGTQFIEAIVQRDPVQALALDQKRTMPTWAKAVFFSRLTEADRQWFLSLPPDLSS